jgi:hypothetical protein
MPHRGRGHNSRERIATADSIPRYLGGQGEESSRPERGSPKGKEPFVSDPLVDRLILSRMADDRPTAPLCSRCNDPMRLARKFARVEPLTEMHFYLCGRCGYVETVERQSSYKAPL